MSKLQEVERLLERITKSSGNQRQEIVLIMEQNGKIYDLTEWEQNKRLKEVEDTDDKLLIRIVEENTLKREDIG